jgi:outer membrane protein assembly factor BamB
VLVNLDQIHLPEEMKEVDQFDLIWANRLDANSDIVNINEGLIYGDWYIYSGDESDPPTIYAYNVSTGDLEWTYIHQGAISRDILQSCIVSNVYIAYCGDGIFGLDLESREVLWTIDFEVFDFSYFKGISIHEGKAYFKVIKSLWDEDSTVEILKIDPHNGLEENVLSIFEDYNNGVSPPAFVYDAVSNRELMIFNEAPPYNLPQESTQNIVAVDRLADTLVWRTENFTPNFASNGGHPPVIYDNRIVITGGAWFMYGFDVSTGQLLWETPINPDSPFSIFNKTNHLLVGDRLFVNEGGENVTCLNPLTGRIIWNNPKGGANCTDNMIYYEKENALVFTSWGYGSIMVLDATTGNVLHQERGYENIDFNNDVVYHPSEDMFFTSTFRHAVGFKLNLQ